MMEATVWVGRCVWQLTGSAGGRYEEGLLWEEAGEQLDCLAAVVGALLEE